jgi:hypothetical protein
MLTAASISSLLVGIFFTKLLFYFLVMKTTFFTYFGLTATLPPDDGLVTTIYVAVLSTRSQQN